MQLQIQCRCCQGWHSPEAEFAQHSAAAALQMGSGGGKLHPLLQAHDHLVSLRLSSLQTQETMKRFKAGKPLLQVCCETGGICGGEPVRALLAHARAPAPAAGDGL